jgi:hypothetical protein
VVINCEAKVKRNTAVLATFLTTGLAFGLVLTMLTRRVPVFGWLGPGLGLAGALLTSVTLSRGLLTFEVATTAGRALAAALILTLAYPTALFLLVLTDSKLQWGAPMLVLGAFACGLVISLVLKMYTARWDWLAASLVTSAAVGSVLLTGPLSSIAQEPDTPLVLIPVGEALVNCMCGYWFIRTRDSRALGRRRASPQTTSAGS